ncbi:MAG TPA: FecR family protein, partial [Leptospiraceae bacterium]|nr:FecR family protein [Leptospiraceae bacterium]
MFILILFIVLSCNEKKQAPEALVTTVIGDVRMGDKKIKSGDVLKNLDSIKTGPKSVCDLQLTGIESNVSIRVKENSEFSLATATQRDSNNVQMKIVSGKIMVNSDKLNSRDNLETITPTVVMAVRGTKYEVEMGSDANGNVAVLDGKVATRVVIPEVENLPPEVRAKSATLKKLDSFLKEKEMVLQTGNATSVSRKQSDTILKETGLGDVLKNADPSKIADDIDTKLSPEKLSEKTAKISDKDLQPEVVQVSPEEMEKKLKEYDEFKPVSKNAIPSSEVKEPEKEVEKPKPEPTKKTEPKIEKKTEAPVNPAPPA